MSKEVEFAVGDLVRFKPEHHHYRDMHRLPDEFIIVEITIGVTDRLARPRVGRDGVYLYRLEHAGGPW